METLNNTTDCEKYLKSGKLTQPFVADEVVLEKVMMDFNHKTQQGIAITKIESLCGWIKHNVQYSQDKSFRKNFKFQRNAKEIWESSLATGCTDYAILFATFARQIGIPTTILHTAEYEWLMKLKTGKDFELHKGHSFCECFDEGRWILVDPTLRKIERIYDAKLLKLSYKIGESDVFVPYFRGNDLGKVQTIKQHNQEMDELCRKL